MKPYIHPVHQCHDGIITSFTKRKIDLKNPTADMICLTDIAQGLANTCRFGGQIQNFYSVAQHSILVTMLAPPELKKAALLHDAAEAYLGDIIKPLKNMISGYAEIETAFERVIFKKFGVDFDLLKEIKPFDKLALEIEYNYIHGYGLGFMKMFKRSVGSGFWAPEVAVERYISHFKVVELSE